MFALAILFLVLLSLSAFFSGSETAVFSLSRVAIHRMSHSTRHSAQKVVEHLRKPRDTLVTILFGNELVNLSISIVGASMVSRSIDADALQGTLLSVLIITPLVLVFGEIIPKNISIRHAPALSEVVIWPLHWFSVAIKPARVVLTAIADGFANLFGGEKKNSFAEMMMEDEFRKMIELGSREGVIIDEERELIHNVFEFSDKVVSEIMTQSGTVFALRVNQPYEGIMAALRSTQFSRMPVFDAYGERILGILHVRDLFPVLRGGALPPEGWIANHLREPLYVTKETSLEALLKGFQKTRVHMAIVLDADGKMAGLVTMADVLQELFGEMEQAD